MIVRSFREYIESLFSKPAKARGKRRSRTNGTSPKPSGESAGYRERRRPRGKASVITQA